MTNLIESEGILEYSDSPTRLVVNIDQEIVRYYRALSPKYWNLIPTRFPAHITVVRPYKETVNSPLWRVHQGKKIAFSYEPEVVFKEPYAYVRVLSKTLESIRQELGLKVTNFAYDKTPPAPYLKFFHFTIGNSKDKQ